MHIENGVVRKSQQKQQQKQNQLIKNWRFSNGEEINALIWMHEWMNEFGGCISISFKFK